MVGEDAKPTEARRIGPTKPKAAVFRTRCSRRR